MTAVARKARERDAADDLIEKFQAISEECRAIERDSRKVFEHIPFEAEDKPRKEGLFEEFVETRWPETRNNKMRWTTARCAARAQRVRAALKPW